MRFTTLKIEKICISPEVPIPPCRPSLIQPLLKPFEHNLGQNSSIKRLFQLTLGPISALESKSTLGSWTELALI